jgi:hypothetical protein
LLLAVARKKEIRDVEIESLDWMVDGVRGDDRRGVQRR